MASYVALVAFAQNDTLRQQIKMAIAMTAYTIENEAAQVVNHAQRVAWAKAALASPDSAVEQIVWSVLAANNTASIAQLQAATDAQVQAAVDAAVTNLFGT